MARIIRKSALGTLRGKVGDAIVTKWKGIDVVKDVPTKKSRKQKEKLSEQPQNLRLALVSSFLKNFNACLAIGFWQKTGRLPAYQRAVQYNLKHAVIGEYPNYELEFSKLTWAMGKREMAWGCTLSLIAAQQFRVEWEIPPTSRVNVIGADIGYILTHISRAEKSDDIQVHQVRRNDLLLDVKRHRSFQGGTLRAWIFFSSADGKISSRSRYLGSLVL